MECPACKISMANHAHGKLSIDVCEKCKGIWFDKDELSAFVNDLFKETTTAKSQNKPHANLPAQEESERMCPVCRKPMVKFKYGSTSDITLDKCPSCKGIWTDAEEVFAIMDFIKKRRTNAKGKKLFSSCTKNVLKTQKNMMDFLESYGPGTFGVKWRKPFSG
ncbi:MAG: zf-TFIIB domain-containing protein [Planctomycetes bacterium]|nr:zf-TFIIB domain-containing protein [Planctomycetota bacterium]